MWTNGVSKLHADLLTAFRPLSAMAHQHPTATLGITLLFVLLGAMLAAEIAGG